MILCWVAKVLTKASKCESDIRPGKDICVYQASNAFLVLFRIDTFIIWSCGAKAAVAINRKFGWLVLVIFHIHALENHLKVGGLIHPNRPFGSIPRDLYAKDLFYLPQVLDLEELLKG